MAINVVLLFVQVQRRTSSASARRRDFEDRLQTGASAPSPVLATKVRRSIQKMGFPSSPRQAGWCRLPYGVKPILLSLIETVDFIHEQQVPRPFEARIFAASKTFEVRNTRKNRANLFK